MILETLLSVLVLIAVCLALYVAGRPVTMDLDVSEDAWRVEDLRERWEAFR